MNYNLLQRIKEGSFSLAEDWTQTKKDLRKYELILISLGIGLAYAEIGGVL